jgi:hypothetical protein
MLEMGRYMTIDELAAAESINGYYVCRIFHLMLPALRIVGGEILGREPHAWSPEKTGASRAIRAVGLLPLQGSI